MSVNKCAFTGVLLEYPVVSTKSGHVFEKSQIEKHLDQTGQCPVTGQDLSKDDLIEIKHKPLMNTKIASTNTIPVILQRIQNEYDSTVLELFHLKKRLQSVKEETNHSLFQHEASIIVINRLIKERDEALKELADLQSSINNREDIEAS